MKHHDGPVHITALYNCSSIKVEHVLVFILKFPLHEGCEDEDHGKEIGGTSAEYCLTYAKAKCC